jgi:hypothetical protein
VVSLLLAGLSILLVPALTTGVVVSQDLGSFSTPYQTSAQTRGTTTGVQQYQSSAAGGFAAYYARSQTHGIVAAVDASAQAAPLIMVTGREFLPIGGYTGSAPSPTLAYLRHLISTKQLRLFIIPVAPAGNDPRLAWIRAHCYLQESYPYGPAVTMGTYSCGGKPASHPSSHPVSRPGTTTDVLISPDTFTGADSFDFLTDGSPNFATRPFRIIYRK